MKKVSMEENVYNHIKTAILARKLAPGKQLVEHYLSNSLGVSRTPIRNAIKRLSMEGLVDIIPNRGAFVTNPTKEEMIQAYELRSKLEYIAVCHAMNFLTESDFSAIKRNLVNEQESLYNRNPEDYVQFNKEFHISITQKCGNKFLNEFILRLITQTNIYLILFDDFFSNPKQEPYSPDEHSHILSLIEDKDTEKLEIVLENHFKRAITSLETHYYRYKEFDEIF
ncbi:MULTISPECIES: GntR family transcriptional regulator [Cytobacillus]|uniref:GntR family transcriptional regulator n=1 Tax=Cytobacillus TaxID=2675230 RepID=UPI0030F705AC